MIERLRENQKLMPMLSPKPFWKTMSRAGWWFFTIGSLTTVGFICGLVFGTFILPSKNGILFEVSFKDHPIWFLLAMAIDGAISLAIWVQLYKWLRQR